MKTPLTPTLLALLSLLAIADVATAQEEGPIDGAQGAVDGSEHASMAEQPRSTDLVFEREVFEYPQFTRRNPFVALVASEGGPRFEQIQLRGIIYSDVPSESVALLGIGSVSEQRGVAQTTTSGTSRSRRVRIGGTWGNVRVLEIHRTEILVEVEEFGLTEQRTMRMPPRGQGD